MNRTALELLSKLRDWLVPGASALYVIGYLTWSVYAWVYHLGPVPALQAQYFVGGVAVAAIVVLLTATAYAIAAAAFRWWPPYLERHTPRTRRVLVLLVSAALLACAGYGVYASLADQPIGLRAMRFVVWIAGIVLLPFFWVTVAKHRGEMKDALILIVLYAYVGILAVSVIGTFALNWYVQLPQTLGGARARPAVLELRTEDLSPELQRDLLAPHADGQAVVRSRQVWVMARYGGSIIVTAKDPILNVNVLPRIELRESSVLSVVWLDLE